tara:strand:- start:607 stop:822 length:216 start_codon:yes stop_codon:yes gene_type:complete
VYDFIPKNKKLFLGTKSGAERSEIELFYRRFVKNDKFLSFVIVGSSPVSSTIILKNNLLFLGIFLILNEVD